MQKIRLYRLPGLAALMILAAGVPVHAATLTWDGGFATDGRWGNGTNWVGDTAPTFGNETDIIFHTNGAGQLSTYTQAARTIRSLTFNEFADADITIRTTTTAGGTTAASLTFEALSGNASITVAAGAAASSIIVGTAGGSIILNSTLEVAHNGTGELLLGRPISGVGGIIKTGAGTMRVNQTSNSFTGDVTINGGTLWDSSLTPFTGLGTGPKNVNLGGGTLLLERSYSSSASSDYTIITTASTASTITYNDLNTATANLTMSGSATLGGDLHVNNISSAGGADAIVWNKATTGAGTLSYSGANQDVLNDISTTRLQVSGDLSGLTGGIEVRKGIWLANGANALGGGIIRIGETASANSAAVVLNANSATTITNDVQVRSGAGTRLIDNTNASGVTRNWSGTITLDGPLTYRSTFDDDFTSASTLTGSGALIKLGTGQLDIRGSNSTYTGNITVSEGELRAVNAGLGSGDVSIASGANLSLQRTSGSILYSNNISGAGTMIVGGGNLIALGGANTSTGDITVGGSGTTLRIDNAAFNNSTANIITSASNSLLRLNANAADQTLANTISGNGFVIKQGNFKTTLTGANTYAGTTTVSAGSLQVGSAGVGQTGSGAVTVNSGSTILGSGIVQGSSFTAESGSTVHAGDGTAQSDYGTLTFTPVSGAGTYDIQSGSSIILGINPGGISDRLVFNGDTGSTLTFSGNLKIGPDSFTPTSAEVFDLIDWAALVTPDFSGFSVGSNRDGSGDNGSQFDLPDIGAGWYWDVSQFTIDGSIAIVAVPEPSRVLLLGIGLLGVMIRRRR